MNRLNIPLQDLKTFRGRGLKLLSKLSENCICTLGRLLITPPRRYIQISGNHLPCITPPQLDFGATVDTPLDYRLLSGCLKFNSYNRKLWRYSIHTSIASERVNVISFCRPGWHGLVGSNIIAIGKLDPCSGHLVHPFIVEISNFKTLPEWATARLSSTIPVYKGICEKWQITYRRAVQEALALIDNPQVEESSYHLWKGYPTLLESLQILHASPAQKQYFAGRCRYEEGALYRRAVERLGLDELLAFRLRLEGDFKKSPSNFDPIKVKISAHELENALGAESCSGEKLSEIGEKLKMVVGSLPFRLRSEQIENCKKIILRLQENKPLKGLLIGDVGSGKTAVAMIVGAFILIANRRVLIMVPNILLANQHHSTFTSLFSAYGYKTILYTGGSELTYDDILRSDIIVATQSPLYSDQQIPNLGLVILDEQHRFGVEQRESLSSKISAVYPHELMLSATPIPRTMHIFRFFPDNLFQLSSGSPRGTRTTHLISQKKITQLLDKFKQMGEIARDKATINLKVYWVCSRISSEDGQGSSAQERAALLRAYDSQTHFEIIELNGKMKDPEKILAMQSFVEAKCAIMVCTTAIEVGIDVSDANFLVIEDPERFGLAQLHQLRGRVGRRGDRSYCFVILPNSIGPNLKSRLKIFKDCEDGMAISDYDLKLRGPGETFSLKQTGLSGNFNFYKGDGPPESLADLEELSDKLKQSPWQNAFMQFWDV